MPEMTKQEFATRLLFWLTPWPLSKALPKALRIYYYGPAAAPPADWYDYWGEPYPAPIDPSDPPDPGDLPDIPPGPINPFDPYTPGPGGTYPPQPGVQIGTLTEVEIECERILYRNTRLRAQGTDGHSWLQARNDPASVDSMSLADYHDEMVGHDYTAFYDRWHLNRTFFIFAVPALPAGKTFYSAKLLVKGKRYNALNVSVERSLQASFELPPFWANVTDISFSHIDWVIDADNTFVFNSAGNSYIQSVLGSWAKLVVRDYTYDYRGVSPSQGKKMSGAWSTRWGLPDSPRLVIYYY